MDDEGNRMLLHPDSTRQLWPAPVLGTAPHAPAPSPTGRGDPIPRPESPPTGDLHDPHLRPIAAGSPGQDVPVAAKARGGRGEGKDSFVSFGSFPSTRL